MNRRLFSAISLAIATLVTAPSAFAQNKMVMGVSIPAATHGWTGGVVYWANRTKAELEKQYPGSSVIVKTAGSAAEQANQSKSQLLAAVSHDVLQPLNAARLFNGALLEQPLDQNQQQLAQSAGRALDDVGDLLRTLVDLSKLDAGQLQPDCSSVALGPLLAALASEFNAMASSKGLRFRAVPTTVTVRTDPAWLARILRNLLTNALRYTPRGSTITLLVQAQPSGALLAVEDNGPGLSEDEMAHVFQRFWRASELPGGCGLGLSIVREIARRHGGDAHAEAVSPQGLRIELLLPTPV